jgi:hypothetical protein
MIVMICSRSPVSIGFVLQPDLQLRYAAQDAHDVAAALRRQAGGLYGRSR